MALSIPSVLNTSIVPLNSPGSNEELRKWEFIRDQIRLFNGNNTRAVIPDSLLVKGIKSMPIEVVNTPDGQEVIDLVASREALTEEEARELFIECLKTNKEALALQLIEHDLVDVSYRDDSRWTLLHFACRAGMEKVVFALMDKGADAYAVDNTYMTTWDYANKFGHTELAGKLILRLDPREFRDNVGVSRSILLAKTLKNYEALLTLASDHIEELRDVDEHDRTALHHVFLEGRIDVGSELIRLGANPDAIDKDIITPLGILLELLPRKTAFPAQLVKLYTDRGIDLDQIARAKELAHIWGIEAYLSVEAASGDDFYFYSLKASGSDHVMEKSTSMFKEFVELVADMPDFAEINTSRIIAALEELPNNQRRDATALAAEVLGGGMVGIPSGWRGHQTAVLFANIDGKPVLIKCQRGEGAEHPGIEIFEIGNINNLEDVIKTLQKDEVPQEEGIKFYNKTMHDLLGLKRLGAISQKASEVNNCAWVSMQCLVLGMLYIKTREVFNPEEAQEKAHQLYKKLSDFSRLKSVYDYTQRGNKPVITLLQALNEKIETSHKPFIEAFKERLLGFINPHLPKPVPIEADPAEEAEGV